MSFEALFPDKGAALAKRWMGLIVATYPDDASGFLKKEQDRFRNPVGYTIGKAIGELARGLVSGRKAEELAEALDNIVRVRAVQDFKPSQAVGFIFLLKAAVRQELGAETLNDDSFGQWQMIEAKVDELALLVFDTYEECRRQIHEIQANELRNRTMKLLQRLNVGSEEEGLPESGNRKDGNTGYA
jgi:hypothetical protein